MQLTLTQVSGWRNFADNTDPKPINKPLTAKNMLKAMALVP